MRELTASTDVDAPSGFAIAFLNTYIQDQAQGAAEAQMHLRFPLQKLFGGLVLEREVTVVVGYEPRPTGAEPLLTIAWRPDETAIFPSFDGTVSAAPRGANACVLTIDGKYSVPGGVAGALFDAVVGVKIATGTIDGLLAEFRTAIETDYRKRRDYGDL